MQELTPTLYRSLSAFDARQQLTASELARIARIGLRSAQMHLKQLADAGYLTAVKIGKKLQYTLLKAIPTEAQGYALVEEPPNSAESPSPDGLEPLINQIVERVVGVVREMIHEIFAQFSRKDDEFSRNFRAIFAQTAKEPRNDFAQTDVIHEKEPTYPQLRENSSRKSALMTDDDHISDQTVPDQSSVILKELAIDKTSKTKSLYALNAADQLALYWQIRENGKWNNPAAALITVANRKQTPPRALRELAAWYLSADDDTRDDFAQGCVVDGLSDNGHRAGRALLAKIGTLEVGGTQRTARRLPSLAEVVQR